MLISTDNLSFGFGGETLLKQITFSLNEGDRVGLIGGNGEGKTTLIRILLGELEPESGNLFVKNGIRLGYLAQNGGYDSARTVWEEIRTVFEEDIRAIEALRDVEKAISSTDAFSNDYRALSAKYEALNKRIAARNSYNFEVKIRTVLNGMGFENAYEQRVDTMSGGEKTRLKLCRLLLEEPELLIPMSRPTTWI